VGAALSWNCCWSRLAATAWRKFRNFGLLVGRRIRTVLRVPPVLQERHAAQSGIGVALAFATTAATLTFVVAAFLMTVAVGLLGTGLTGALPALAALLRRLLAVLAAAVTPTLVVAVHQPAHGLDHTEIVIGVLPVGLGLNAIARGCRLARQRLVLVEHLMRVAANAHVGPAAVKNLVPVWRPVRIVVVVLLMMIVAATAAATAATAAATRPLPIVWSH